MEGAGECMIIVQDMNKGRRCHKHNIYNDDEISDFSRMKLSRASQTNQGACAQQKTSRSAQARSLYDCPSNVYRSPPAKRTEYYTEFPPQKKFCPYRGNFASCRYLDLTRPCKSSTLWRERATREPSPNSSLTDPFVVSLRRYSNERRNSSAHLLRKLLIYTQARSSPRNFNIRSLRNVRKSQSSHKDKLLNKKPQKKSKDEKETENIHISNSFENIGREISRKPSPVGYNNEAKNNAEKEEPKVRHAKVGAGTKRSKPDLSATYDYLQNSSCSLYLPRGILDRTMEVRYLDDVTRCVKDTIKMLCESEKDVACPTIANRYMRHVSEYHHRDAQAQANFLRGTTDHKTLKKNWSYSLIDFNGASQCAAPSPCRQEPKKCHFQPCSLGPVCYFPDAKDNDEQLFPDRSIGGIIQEWMKGIPINANFSPTDKLIRDRIVVELTNNLSSFLTEPNFEAKARKVIFNYLSDLPMWLPEGEAQIKFKNQLVDVLIYRLTEIRCVIAELKSELLRWIKNVDYEPRYDDGEIVTDRKIVNSMTERLEPLIMNRSENESVHKNNLQREIVDELLNIPLDVRDEFKCKVINNLADDLASRLVWLNAKLGVAKKRSECLSIRNIINDWMENIPVNPFFSQIDLELREQLADDLANKLTKLRTDPNLVTIGRDAIIKFLENLPMWWPGDDDKDIFINELTDKLIYKLGSPEFFVEVENVVSIWTRNINTENIDDVIHRVLDKIIPVMSYRQRLDKEDYKSKLKRSICEELTSTPIDFKGENKRMVINRLAENLTDMLIELDETDSGVGQKRSKAEYCEIYNIINNWVKTLPVNHDFSIKEKEIRDQMAKDLVAKLTQIKNDANMESKVKEASLQFLLSIPIWTPDDNEKDRFMTDMSNKLCNKVLRFYSNEDELKRVISKWAEKVNHRPKDENGNSFDKNDITENVIQKVRTLVLNRPDNDVDYNGRLKKAISEELRKFALNVPPQDKNRVISDLAEDLAYNLVNLQCESTASYLSAINDTVLKWLNDITATSDFKMEDDELRKELGQQLIDKLAELTDDPKKIIEIPMEAEVKKTVIDCLKNLPMWRPRPGKEDEYYNELVDKLFKNLKEAISLISQSRDSKSDENKLQSTSKQESNASEASGRKGIDSKSEKRRKSSLDKRKSGDSENKKKRTSNASDSGSGRKKSSDSTGDGRKSREGKSEKRRKSSASNPGRKKTTDSSGNRRSRKDKIKSGDSKTENWHRSDSSDIDRGKSSESSGDRRKSHASDTGRNKSSDTKRNKSVSSDSNEKRPSDARNGDKRRSSHLSGANTTNLLKRESKSGGPFSDRSSSPIRPSKRDSTKRKSPNYKSHFMVSSTPSVERRRQKKVFEILKDSSMLAHPSPMKETRDFKNITNEVKEFPISSSVEIINFIDEAVTEWIDVLEKKAMEKHFRDNITKCFKTFPEIYNALDNKLNQNLVHELAIKLTDYKTSDCNKAGEEKIKDDLKKIVKNIFENENIAAKKQSLEVILQAIMNVTQQRVEKNKYNLKEILETELTQWMKSIPKISDLISKNEHRKALKKLAYDIQILAARKSTDSVVLNRMQQKITLFLETVLEKENIIIESKLKKKHKTNLLNNIMFLIRQNKKKAESVSTLKSELSFWLVNIPLLKNALCSGHVRDMRTIFHILGLRKNLLNNTENPVRNVVSEFITETIEKSCGSIPEKTKSILQSELLHTLNIEGDSNRFGNEQSILIKLSGYYPGLSNKINTLKILIEEVIKNHIPLQSDANCSWAKNTEDEEVVYIDMAHELAEILENKFLFIFTSRKDEIKDISEYLQTLIHKKGSPVDNSIVNDLTRELMADVNINLGIKRNKKLRHLLKETSNKLKQCNEDDDLWKHFESSTEKFNDNNISHLLKERSDDDDIIKYNEVTSEDEEIRLRKLKISSNLLIANSGIKQINKTSRSLYKTNDNEQNDVHEKKPVSRDNEHKLSMKSISHCRSHASLLRNQENQSTSKDFSNKPVISGRYSETINGKGNTKGNLKSSHPPSTSQSSEDLANNTYSLRKYILNERTRPIRFANKKRRKSNSPIRRTPSSPKNSDDSPIDEEEILSIIKRRLYQSPMNDPDVFNVVPYMNRPSTSKATTKVKHSKGSDTDLYHVRLKETNRRHSLLRNKSPFENKDDEIHTKNSQGKIEHFEDEPLSISAMDDNISKNLPSLKRSTDRKDISEILVKRVGLTFKEARKFADLLIEKTNNIYENYYDGLINKPIDTVRKTLKHEVQDILRNFHIDHMSEETEVSIINLLSNQVAVGKVNDTVRTSLMNILAEVDENVAANVADSLLEHVTKISFTVPPKLPGRKPMRQYLTALSVENKSSLNFGKKPFTSQDNQKYLEVRQDIVDFVKERVPSPTPSITEIIDTATEDLLRIYINSKGNKETSTEDLESIARREIKNFLLTVPIETDESKKYLINEIANKLHDVDSIIRSSSGETTTSTLSRNLSLVWTLEQQEAFLQETKKLINDILEENNIDVSQTKHLNLDDKLREILSSKKFDNAEKLDQMKKEFSQYFRNLSSLSSTHITPDDLAIQVVEKIPSIITKLATSIPNQKDFVKVIVDFIRAKTGDMTPHSLQQLQVQVEEIMAITKSILDDSDMTPNEKCDNIKLGFSRFISEIPRQSSETADQLASELYDKIFGPSGLIHTTPSPSLSSSNEEVMIIRNNETRYLNQLINIIRNWSDQVPMIRDEINDIKLKDNMAKDLAKDITDRQKYKQLNKGAKTSDEDELEYLKYQVFRWLNRTLDVNDLGPFVNYIEELMEQIRLVPTCPLVKPSNKLLEDEIAKWVEQVPCNRVTPKGYSRQIKDLADKIQRHRGKPHADSKINNDISQFIPSIFKEDETTLKALTMQLKTFLKNQGLLRGTNAKTYKTGAEDLYELVEDWCRDLPIYLGDSPEEQERVKTIKQNINSKLINKIGELNMNPQILNDDFLYEDLLLDEVDKLLTKVPRNPELEKYLPALKKDLISRVKGARQKIRDEQAGHAYIQHLRDNIASSALIPEPLYPDELIYFEILRENLVDAFINLHYVRDDKEDEIKFKRKISEEISRFCNDYLRRHPCTPIDPTLLSRQLYQALQAIPIPKDESLRSEIEELKIKEILFEWVKEIPLKEETGSELLQRNKTIAVLAKRLREVEKEKESNINFNSEGSIREEITKWLRRNPLKVGHESEMSNAIDKIVEKLKKPDNVLDFSISFADDCSCPQNKPIIPPCTLSAEDRAHLKRIRDKYNSPCITGKSSLTIESCSQTIEPQTWSPNLKTEDRFTMCSSKQSPFPCPAMMSSASPHEMHQYPNVNVKNYVWDSTDPNVSSTQTPHLPCQSKAPYCIQKQMSTQQPLPECNSVSSQVSPEYEPITCPRSSAFKCSSTQARPNSDIPCSTPKANRFIDSQDSEEEDSSSECSPCRPVINSGVCRMCRPSGVLYSSYLPRKSKKKEKKKRSSEEFDFPRIPNRFEPCGKEKSKPSCSCKERNTKKGDKYFCYRTSRVSKITEDDCLGHSEAECPHPSYMYFRN